MLKDALLRFHNIVAKETIDIGKIDSPGKGHYVEHARSFRENQSQNFAQSR